MEAGRLGFWARLWMWIWLPWKVLFDGAAAWTVEQALRGSAAPRAVGTPSAKAPKPEAKPAPEVDKGEAAVHLLAILQRDGRLVDFLQEEIASASDVDVGAAARIVHEGCRKALSRYVSLAPIRPEEEGAVITVPAGFDPAELRLTGNVVGQPPFKGRLAHPGWKATEVRLPAIVAGQDPSVVSPAEVEL